MECGSRPRARRGAGFTLIEMLVVIGIIALLAALIFPIFRSVQERSRQTRCSSNLHQIGLAVLQYRKDYSAFPGSMAALVGNDVQLNDTRTTALPPPVDTLGFTGLLKTSSDTWLCTNDQSSGIVTRSSYGDLTTYKPLAPIGGTDPSQAAAQAADPARYVWNFWGYDPSGFSTGEYYNTADPYQMSNRYAKPQTIVTHCIYHRARTGRDIALRLDGSAKSIDASVFDAQNYWQKPLF